MKRYFITRKVYIFAAAILLLMGVALFFLLSKPGLKTPERALFVQESNMILI